MVRPVSLDAEVRQRAQNCCEYCRFPAAVAGTRFQVDHIRARQHGGRTVADNLALACERCNLFKGPNLAAIDPANGATVVIFNPRTDDWHAHFQRRGATIAGLSSVGRATVSLLNMNAAERVAARAALIAAGKLPADDLAP
jgi:hypothetical protein